MTMTMTDEGSMFVNPDAVLSVDQYLHHLFPLLDASSISQASELYASFGEAYVQAQVIMTEGLLYS